MEIAILRHGKPDAMSEKKIYASSFVDWIKGYNASSLSKSSVPTDSALSYANKCKAIVCSSLQRSIDSAKALSRKKIVLSDELFVEAGMPSTNLGFLKLSPGSWATIFRVLWFLGYSKNSESAKEAKTRAAKAAVKLVEFARQYKCVLFVGHGIFNRLLAHEFKKMGWFESKKPGSTYWSFVIYKKK